MTSYQPKKNHNACFICLKTTARYPGISLHRFPTNDYQRSLWLQACGLKETDYKSSRRVCSLHFTEESFNKHNVRKCLYPGSVPSIFSEDRNVGQFARHICNKPKPSSDNNKKRRSRSKCVTTEQKPRDKSPFCPTTMIRYDTPFNYQCPTKWVCRICLAFMLNENAALRHFVTCKLPGKLKSETDDDDNDDVGSVKQPEVHTILRYIERSSSPGSSSGEDIYL